MMIMSRGELITRLRSLGHIIRFTKVDGSERIMRCTLDSFVIPEKHKTENTTTRKASEEVVRVYDLDLSEWRSFRVDSLTELDGHEITISKGTSFVI